MAEVHHEGAGLELLKTFRPRFEYFKSQKMNVYPSHNVVFSA